MSKYLIIDSREKPKAIERILGQFDEPQTYITEDRDTQILDAWQVHHRNITTVEDEPTTEQSSKVGEWIVKANGNNERSIVAGKSRMVG